MVNRHIFREMLKKKLSGTALLVRVCVCVCVCVHMHTGIDECSVCMMASTG